MSNRVLKLKIFFKQLMTKLGLSNEFDFSDYRKRRNIFIIIVVAALGLVAATSFVVGGIYQNKALLDKVSELNSTIMNDKTEIDSLKKLTANYSDQITQRDKLMDSYVNQVKTLNNSIFSLNSSLADLQNQNVALQNLTTILNSQIVSYQTNTTVLTQAINSASRAVCCTLTDLVNGVVKNWSLVSGSIVCTGNMQVNCGSGLVSGS